MEATATLMGASAQKKAMNAEARLQERQALDVDLQSAEAAARRREQLLGAMQTIETRRAASGLSGDSPTAIAIENEMRKRVSRDIAVDGRGYRNQKYALLQGAAVNRAGAKNAMIVGSLRAYQSISDQAASVMAAGAK